VKFIVLHVEVATRDRVT